VPESWNEPITINEAGTRCVVETNWGPADGDRCQMIWELTPGGGVVVTTCRPDVPPIRLNAAQRMGLAYFLRRVDPQRPTELPPAAPAPRPPSV
jgi:hypothetical protein